MTVHLLDLNVLMALAWPQHIHHAPAHRWFADVGSRAWATCPLTQLGLIRLSSNPKVVRDAVRPRDALALLRQITRQPGHHFWPDSLEAGEADTFGTLALVGHLQVTDAYLISLCQRHKGRLATFDRGLPQLVPRTADRARLVTVIGP